MLYTEADAAVSVCRGAAADRRIVEETLISGVSVATVARAHELNANQLFHWRKLYRAGLLGDDESGSRMLPVTVCGDHAGEALRADTLAGRAGDSAAFPHGRAGSMELTVGKAQLRISGAVDAAALRLVLECLVR